MEMEEGQLERAELLGGIGERALLEKVGERALLEKVGEKALLEGADEALRLPSPVGAGRKTMRKGE